MKTTKAVAQLLAEAGPTVDIPMVARCYGIGRATAYELAQRGELGVPILKLGRKLRVPTADLRRILGLGVESEQGGGSAA